MPRRSCAACVRRCRPGATRELPVPPLERCAPFPGRTVAFAGGPGSVGGRHQRLRAGLQAAAVHRHPERGGQRCRARWPRCGRSTTLVDRMAQWTVSTYQQMLELSTPVVKLWEGVLALPMIGTLDSARTQVVMETLLQRIVETGSEPRHHRHHRRADRGHAGGPAPAEDGGRARLMGADCIISGIRPQIAQTIVHLGVDLGRASPRPARRRRRADALGSARWNSKCGRAHAHRRQAGRWTASRS